MVSRARRLRTLRMGGAVPELLVLDVIHESGLFTMYFGGLDAECYRLREEGFSVRQIGRKLGIASSAVQRCLARVETRRARAAVEELGDAPVPAAGGPKP